MANLSDIDIFHSTKEDFLSLQHFRPKGDFGDFIVVPTGQMHDSGYETMKFVLCNSGKVVGVVSGCSDVIHLNGIGGYGKIGSSEPARKPIAWNIDCLPGSGCLHFWCNQKLSIDEFVGSDFCVYVEN